MKVLLIKIGSIFLNFVYLFFKPLRVRNKVTFISRQSNKKSEDILMLEKELNIKKKDIEIVVLCKKLESNPVSIIKYFFHLFVQMYHLSTSKVIVLDSYCIVASILKKKKGTTIIQMWHAIGAFKKFGYSILDQEEGRNSKIASAMKMHKNNDYVLTSSDYTKKYFAEAFNCDISKLKVYPLPRVDKLRDKEYLSNIKEKVYKTYPKLRHKKNIVYAPTFRKDKCETDKIYELVNSIDYTKFNLIIKFHPLSKIVIDSEGVIVDKKFSTIDMMMISDYVITDYSAVVFEAALLKKPIFLYAYDFSKYYKKRNFYLDYKKEMPGFISTNATEIISAVENNDYDLKRIREFSKKFVETSSNGACSNLSKFILKNM